MHSSMCIRGFRSYSVKSLLFSSFVFQRTIPQCWRLIRSPPEMLIKWLSINSSTLRLTGDRPIDALPEQFPDVYSSLFRMQWRKYSTDTADRISSDCVKSFIICPPLFSLLSHFRRRRVTYDISTTRLHAGSNKRLPAFLKKYLRIYLVQVYLTLLDL